MWLINSTVFDHRSEVLKGLNYVDVNCKIFNFGGREMLAPRGMQKGNSIQVAIILVHND